MTYAENVVAYAQAGWPCILPVPVRDKFPPPVGFTGAEGRDTDPLQLVQFATTHPGHSIALRMPDGVIGIDVDQYVKGESAKNGAATLQAALDRWGPLPATWTSTAREPGGASRIYFFRVPPRRYATKLGPDVEVIQRHHRYAVVWPSPHHATGGTYTWYDPTGCACDAPPKPNELPELPAAWVAGLAEGSTEQGPAPADAASGHRLLEQLLDDWRPECAEVTSARLTATDAMSRADAGSRHDTMVERTYPLVQLAATGHTGAAHALLELRDLWGRITAGEDRAHEYDAALLGAARKAVTVVGGHQVPRDPCLVTEAFWLPAPAPGDPGHGDDEGLQIVEPPRWLSAREVIGTHAFDPVAGLDQSLAEAVLARTYPVLRYAYDSGGWLVRCPERWELHGRLSPWAVAQVASLMPLGDPTAEKGSEQHDRSQRRGRLMSTPGARAIAGKMDDLVAGGMHPASLALADLDADPEVLWAGGVPWSLRASGATGAPAPAQLDPTTPHLHSAALSPQQIPTPLWDAFLAAVWPDPAVRGWALRVLSIAATGYADRALPILLGETGRGKTQVVTLLMSVLGSYAHAADPRLLQANTNAHASIVFALKGRRLSFIDEAPRDNRAGQERLKQLTGGGELTANQMNQNPITFRPTHTLILTANDDPVLTDPAVRARTRLLPCDGDPEAVRLARKAIGHVAGPAWRAEAPGVLAQLLVEAGRWLGDPGSAYVTAAPEGIRFLAEELGSEQDPITVWLEEETEPCTTGTPSRELYQAFAASCLRSNVRRDQIPSETRWGRELTRRGYAVRHTEHGKRRPLRLRTGGGFLPGMDPAPAVTGLTGSPDTDGFLTGSAPNPSGANPQVNPPLSVEADGMTGLSTNPAHAHARDARVRPDLELPVNPSAGLWGETPETAPDLRERPDDGFGQPVSPAKPKRQQTEAAREKAARTRAERRAAAIAEAAAARVPLPAVVTRDGVVRSCAVDDAAALLGTLGPEVTVDVEHTGYPVGHADYRLRTIQIGDERLAVVLDATDPRQAGLARDAIAGAGVLHAHSATADLVPLADAGLVDFEEALARMVDTAVLAKLADPGSTDNSADLKGLAKAVLREYALSPDADSARDALFKAGKWLTDTEVTTPVERSGWAQVDHASETMVRYDASDVLDCAALARRLPRPAPEAMARERLAQTMTARIAWRGVRIDGEQVSTLLPRHEDAKAGYLERIRAYGVDNPGSPAQVGARMVELGAVLPMTPTGKPSVAEGVLEPLVGDREREPQTAVEDLARLVIDWREHDTALKLFLRPYDELVRRGDGRARPTVYTLGAKTGRMSCVRPNLQQLPRAGGFRACITADPGHLLVSADFASVELRVAAALSRCPSLTAIVLDPDRDLHWEIARIAFGPDATKAQRYAVKRGVFGRIYGGGVGAVARGVGVSEARARAVIDAMDALTPGLTEWSRMVREGIKAGRTQFPAYSGRTIHLPKVAAHAGPNYCIQGTARELLIDALERWSRTPWATCTLWPVHDEVVVMVPEDQAEAATDALVGCMTSDLFGVPIKAEASQPTYAWADSE